MTDFVSLKDMGKTKEIAEPKKRPKIVSLGFDCCMRTILTKLKYKPSKKKVNSQCRLILLFTPMILCANTSKQISVIISKILLGNLTIVKFEKKK